MTPLTSPALRAAIALAPLSNAPAAAMRQYARIINEATGLPELIAALELASDCLMGHHFETQTARLGENCSICLKRHENVFTVIAAALAKAKGIT